MEGRLNNLFLKFSLPCEEEEKRLLKTSLTKERNPTKIHSLVRKTINGS